MKFLKITLLLSLLSPFLHGHPIPDIPVVGKFNSDGNCSIYIGIDTRSFAEDPEQVPFLTSSDFKKLSEEIRENSNIQLITKNKTEQDILNLLSELVYDHKEQSNLKKIESLEKKLINNLDENSYSELIKLKSQLNRE